MENQLKPKLPMMELKLAKNLKSLLTKRQMTAVALSRRTGVPNTTIANWLAGYPPRNVMQVQLVAQYFNLSLDELLFDAGRVSKNRSILERYEDDIFAGVYEVVLRKVK